MSEQQEQPLTGDFSSDVDRFPNLVDVLQRVLEAEDIPKTDVQKVEINCLANGEATARVWAARAEEPEGVFLEPR